MQSRTPHPLNKANEPTRTSIIPHSFFARIWRHASFAFGERPRANAALVALGAFFAGVACSLGAQPSPLRILSITPNNGNLILRWEGGRGPYQVVCRTNFTEDWTKVGQATSATSATVPSAPRVSRFYLVTTDMTAPDVPTNLRVTTNNSYSELVVDWDPASDNSGGAGLRGYNVYRNNLLISRVQTPTTLMVDAGLTEDTTYSYSVSAVDLVGNQSLKTSTVSARTPKRPDKTAPTTPLGLAATATSCTQVYLSWNASSDTGGSGLKGYEIYRNGVYLKFIAAPTPSNTDTSASESTGYTYTVLAVDNAGNKSAQSGSAFVSTPACPCNYSLASTAVSVGSAGGNGSVNLTAGANCSWNATSSANWITITSGNSGSGSRTIYYTVAANPSTSSRSGMLTIAGLNFTVNQAGAPSCSYSLSSQSASYASAGGNGTVNVTTSVGCGWSAVSHAAWITITAGANGSGIGTVSYSVTANTSTSSRIGTLTIAGITFTVSQAGAPPCSYTLSSTGTSMGAGGGGSSVGVTAGVGCAWSATSSAGWITITSGTPGSGNGTVYYSVAANTSASSRNGSLTIAGQSYSVSQAGSVDTTPPTASLTSPANGSTVSGTITLAANASDNIGVTRVEFYRDNNNLLGTDTTTPFSLSFNTTGLANGTYPFHCKAYDAAGNPGISSINNVTINNGALASGQFRWANDYGGTNFDYGQAVAVDRSANVIITGQFSGPMDFGGGLLPVASSGNILLAKYSSSGNHVWSKGFGLSGSGIGLALATDVDGNIYLGGNFFGTLDFGAGPISGWDGPFVAKFTASGLNVWSKSLGGVGKLKSLAVDGSGNVIATGYTTGATEFGAGIFFVKYSGTDGRLLWSRNLGGNPADSGNGIAVDSSGNILIVGSFSGTLDFGGGPLTSSATDIFVVKYSNSGSHLWSRKYGGVNRDIANSVATDGNGNVLVTGQFMATIDFGGIPLSANEIYDSAFLVKLSASGTHLWSKKLGGLYYSHGHAVSTDQSGNVSLTGKFNNTVDFGNGPITSTGGYDAFVAKYSATNGSHIWSKAFGSNGGGDEGLGLTVDASGETLVIGRYFGAVNFGGGSQTSVGQSDIVVAKYAP